MPDGSRSLAVWLYQDGAMNRVLARDIPAPALAPGKGADRCWGNCSFRPSSRCSW
jgi:hypothetical protein